MCFPSTLLHEQKGKIKENSHANIRSPGDTLTATFIKWEHLLQMITENHPAFLSALTEEMANDLAFTTDPAHCEALYLWLDHILRSTEWKPSRQLLSSTYLLAICEGSPNRWTDMLKGILLKEDEKKERKSYAAGKSLTNSADATANADTVLHSHTDAGDAQVLQKLGWESLDWWDSRPLGVV